MNDQTQPPTAAAPPESFNEMVRRASRLTAPQRNARYGPASFMSSQEPGTSGDIPTVPVAAALVDPVAAFVQPVDFGGGNRGTSPSDQPRQPDFNDVIREGARLAGSVNPGRYRGF
ncbi:MAG: hypothetical protein ACOYBP_09225 [Microbacteriaceae bacterium]